MSNPQARRASSALVIVALIVTAGCARGRNEPESAPGPAPSDPSVGEAEGKSIEAMFQGRFPGVTVTRADNGGLKILIRGGASSFSGSDEPLYVVDDTPLPSGSGGIVYLNPYDIAKIEILKNPADTGIYGIRGGNGVIRITTKRPGQRRS